MAVGYELREDTAGFATVTLLENRPGETNQSAWSCRTWYETHQISKELKVLPAGRSGSFKVGWKLVLDGIGIAGLIMLDLVLGLNRKPVAEHIYTAIKLFHVQMKTITFWFWKRASKAESCCIPWEYILIYM